MNQSALAEQTLSTIETEIRPSLRPLEEKAKAIRIVDQHSYDQCYEIAARAVEARNGIKKRLAPGKTAAHAAWKEWVGLENDLLAMVTGAEKIAKVKIAAWDQEQERIRQEEQRRLEEEARKRAEEEKLAAAQAAQDEGAPEEELDAILDEPEVTAPAYVQPTYERRGASSRENWKAQVVSLPALIKYVAAHPELIHLLQPAMPAINAMARAQKAHLRIPGVRVYNDTNVAIRSRR